MAFIIDNEVKGIFKQFIVLVEISVLRNYNPLSFGVGVGKHCSIDTQVFRISDKIFNLTLLCGHNENTPLALLDEPFSNAKSGICFTRTCSIGKHITLSVCVQFVIVAFIKELYLCLKHIILLLRQEERKCLTNIKSISDLNINLLRLFLQLYFLLYGEFCHLVQLLLLKYCSPLGHLSYLSTILNIGVPALFNKVLYLLWGDIIP